LGRDPEVIVERGMRQRAKRSTEKRPVLMALLLGAAMLTLSARAAEAPKTRGCEKIVLTGEVSSGHAWQAEIGEGWVFRVLPIAVNNGSRGASGWDLVVDRKKPAGYPDALLLATRPYNFMNEREVGTTYGLRAQDAIGWNPRNFRFMTNHRIFRKAQRLYLKLNQEGALGPKPPNLEKAQEENAPGGAMRKLIALAKQSSPGQFRILDAHLTPGAARVAPYAAHWAAEAGKTPHTDVPPRAGPTPFGRLEWIRFSVTLWLPHGWRVPKDAHAVRASCTE
jgi:hypothetical protein